MKFSSNTSDAPPVIPQKHVKLHFTAPLHRLRFTLHYGGFCSSTEFNNHYYNCEVPSINFSTGLEVPSTSPRHKPAIFIAMPIKNVSLLTYSHKYLHSTSLQTLTRREGELPPFWVIPCSALAGSRHRLPSVSHWPPERVDASLLLPGRSSISTPLIAAHCLNKTYLMYP